MTQTLIEDTAGDFSDFSCGEHVMAARYTNQVWDNGDGTFLQKYGSCHSYGRIHTYWMTLWAPNPKWYNKNKKRYIRCWTVGPGGEREGHV